MSDIRCGKAEQAMADCYKLLLRPFMAWATKHHQVNISVLPDLFQDLMVYFYVRVLNTPEFTVEQNNAVIYLWAAWKNLIAEEIKSKHHKLVSTDPFEIKPPATEPVSFRYENDESIKKILKHAVTHTSKKCREILNKVIFYQQDLNSITREMGYSDVNSTKVVKSRCMKALRDKLASTLSPQQIQEIFQNPSAAQYEF